MFYHLSPEVLGVEHWEGRLTNLISVPVLDLDQSRFVEVGTAAVVLMGFWWVIWCLFGVWRREGYGSSKDEGVKEKKTQ